MNKARVLFFVQMDYFETTLNNMNAVWTLSDGRIDKMIVMRTETDDAAWSVYAYIYLSIYLYIIVDSREPAVSNIHSESAYTYRIVAGFKNASQEEIKEMNDCS